MKKRLVSLLGVVVLLLCSACAGNQWAEPESAGTDGQADITQAPGAQQPQIGIPVLRRDQARQIYDYSQFKNGGMETVGFLGFHDQTSFGQTTNRLGNGSNGQQPYAVTHLDSGKVSLVSQPRDLEPWVVGTFSNVVMQGRLFFQWNNYEDDASGRKVNKLLRIDAETNQLTIVKQRVLQTVPFIYCSKLNEKEFIYSYCDLEQYQTPDQVSVCVVVKYNVETGEEREIIREHYRNMVGWPNSTGMLLEQVCAVDQEIYAFGRKNENGTYRFYLYRYDAEGRLLQTIPAQSLANVLQNSQMDQINVIGSYLFFGDWKTGLSYIYQIGAEDVSLVAGGPQQRIEIPAHYNNITETSKCPYLVYYHGPTMDGAHRDNYLYAIELATGRTKQIDVQLDAEKPCLRYMQIDENGNMIFDMVRDHFDSLNIRQFYVTSGTIQKLFSEAPYVE